MELQVSLPEVSRRALLERIQSVAVPFLLSKQWRAVKEVEAARRLVALCRVGELAAKELCRWAVEAVELRTGGERKAKEEAEEKEEESLCRSVRGAGSWLRLLSSLHAEEMGKSCLEEVARAVKQLLERVHQLLLLLLGGAGGEEREVEECLLYGIQTFFSLLCPMVESQKFLKDRYDVLNVLLQVLPAAVLTCTRSSFYSFSSVIPSPPPPLFFFSPLFSFLALPCPRLLLPSSSLLQRHLNGLSIDVLEVVAACVRVRQA